MEAVFDVDGNLVEIEMATMLIIEAFKESETNETMKTDVREGR